MKQNLSSLTFAALTAICALCIAGPTAAQVAGGTTTVEASVSTITNLDGLYGRSDQAERWTVEDLPQRP